MTAAVAFALTTPLSLLLLGLVALNLAALLRPVRLLSRAVAAALLLPLLLLLALLRKEPLTEGGATWPPTSRAYVGTALAASLAIALLLALRPNPFEYPGDSTEYLQTFIQAQLEAVPARSCLVEGWRQPTYQRFCTLWGVVLQAGHLDPATLLSGWPQRLTIGLEVGVLGLTSFRLLQAAGVGAAAAALSWLLVAFGLGNQSIAFLVNHGLQGSILAAAVFLEAAMVMLRLLLWRSSPRRQAGGLLASLLVFLLLTLKLHGAFALCVLALLVPLLALLGAARLGGQLNRPEAFGTLSKASARWLLLASLGLLVVVLSVKTGWLVNKHSRFIIPWSFLGSLGLPPQALPASYLMRSPGSRPETLAVASMLIGIVHLARRWRPGGAVLRADADRTPWDGTSDPGRAEARLYALVSSLYGVSVLLAFLLPPFSHLFINLPYEVISNYRLMWGCILFSPLPCLLDRGLTLRPGHWPARLVTVIMAVVVLVPISGKDARKTQIFWSKSRHILAGPSERVDMQAVARALMPSILEIQAEQGGGRVVVLADELIGSALSSYPDRVAAIHPSRVINRAAMENWETHALLRKANTDTQRLEVLEQLKNQPTLLIQQTPIGPYYSPYSEIRVYDADIGLRLTTSGVNQLSPALLQRAGFRPWRWLSLTGDAVKDPAAAGTAPPGPDPRQATYHVWRRMP